MIRRLDREPDELLLGMTYGAVQDTLWRFDLPRAHAWRRGWAVQALRRGISVPSIMAAGGRERGILRMIYDRLAWLDKDLKVTPWALESWKKINDHTWDAKLRDGMKFHDGKPVTVDDLKFSLDFFMKYDRQSALLFAYFRVCQRR